jgi:small conductance mechanosensitive channel
MGTKMSFSTQVYFDKAIELIIGYGPKVMLALITLVLGSLLVNLIGKILENILDKVNFDDTLQPYMLGMSITLLKVILYISVIGMLGVQTTSFIAVLGAAGLAIGMALQGSLGNFAGGILLLVFKPIKKGDWIETNGIVGIVESIQPFVTVLNSLDNVVTYVPNAELSSGAIKNYSINAKRRVDLTFGIGYGDDIDAARAVFRQVITDCPNTIDDVEPEIFVTNLGDSSVDFVVRPFCKPEHYWEVYFYMNEFVKKGLDNAGISIPFPQRDVHIKK